MLTKARTMDPQRPGVVTTSAVPQFWLASAPSVSTSACCDARLAVGRPSKSGKTISVEKTC